MAAAERSPSVLMCTSSTGTPVAAVIASATVCDCVVASRLARVPSCSVRSAAVSAGEAVTGRRPGASSSGSTVTASASRPPSAGTSVSMPRPNSSRRASA